MTPESNGGNVADTQIRAASTQSGACKHEWLIPLGNRTTCKLCGSDGWVREDELVKVPQSPEMRD